ncbi:MAG TPA: hypothetical protein V6D19_13000 [Stenomitos sp.]
MHKLICKKCGEEFLSKKSSKFIKSCSRKCGSTKHGLAGTRFYKIWASMIRRCYNENQYNFKFYGAKGIFVSQDWLNFEEFKKDMYGSYLESVLINGEANTSLDRINNKDCYQKNNCRWATMKQQARNRSTSRLILYDGKNKSLAQWAEDYNLTYAKLKLRLKRGWSIERALSVI